jgi:hypothetical protein
MLVNQVSHFPLVFISDELSNHPLRDIPTDVLLVIALMYLPRFSRPLAISGLARFCFDGSGSLLRLWEAGLCTSA